MVVGREPGGTTTVGPETIAGFQSESAKTVGGSWGGVTGAGSGAAGIAGSAGAAGCVETLKLDTRWRNSFEPAFAEEVATAQTRSNDFAKADVRADRGMVKRLDSGSGWGMAFLAEGQLGAESAGVSGRPALLSYSAGRPLTAEGWTRGAGMQSLCATPCQDNIKD